MVQIFCSNKVLPGVAGRSLHVFAGPSVPLAQRALEHVRYLPPAGRGDIEALTHESDPAGLAIALIDGKFGTSLAVPVLECRQAMERGAVLFGLASLGALRAADLWPVGMVGYGDIYFAYRTGLLSDDSEVAVQYSEDLSRELTISGVRCRSIVARLARDGAVSACVIQELCEDLLRIHWSERTPDRVVSTILHSVPDVNAAALVSDEELNPKATDTTRFLHSTQLLFASRPPALT